MCAHLPSSAYGCSAIGASVAAASVRCRSTVCAIVERSRCRCGLVASVESVADFVAYFAR